jgi:toxin ParE1/3/4
VTYYREQAGFNIARDFNDAAMRAALSLLEYPELGVRISHETRRFLLHDYPYSLIYRTLPAAIIIVALAHQSRRPGYWVGQR